MLSKSNELTGAQRLVRADEQLDKMIDLIQAIVRLPELAELNEGGILFDAPPAPMTLDIRALVMMLMGRALEGLAYERASSGDFEYDKRWMAVERYFIRRCLALADGEYWHTILPEEYYGSSLDAGIEERIEMRVEALREYDAEQAKARQEQLDELTKI